MCYTLLIGIFLPLAKGSSTTAWTVSPHASFHRAFHDFLDGSGPLDVAARAFSETYGARIDKGNLNEWLRYYRMPTKNDQGPASVLLKNKGLL